MSGNSLPEQNRDLRYHPPSSPKQEQETRPKHRRNRLIASQSVAEGKKNSNHLPSVGDDTPGPKEMHHTTCDDSSLNPKVVLTRIKPETCQSLADHSKNSKHPRAHHALFSSPVENKATEVPRGMEELAAQTKINGHDLSASEDGVNVHRTTCDDYSTLQPKVVLTRIKPKILQSLSSHNKNSGYTRTTRLQPSSPVVKKETEVLCGTEEHIAQTKIDVHNISASQDDNDVHHTTCHYRVLQPKVVLTKLETKLFDSLSNNGSPNSSNSLQAAHLSPPPVEETKTEETLKREGPAVQSEAQIETHVFSLVAKLLDSVCNDSSPNSSKCLEGPLPPCPVEEIETEQTLKRERPEVQLEAQSEACVSLSEDAEHKLQTSRTVHEYSSEKDAGSVKKSKNVSVFPFYRLVKEVRSLGIPSQPKVLLPKLRAKRPGLNSNKGLQGGRKRRKRRHPPLPKRVKPGVRSSTEKKINYCDPSSEEEEDRYCYPRSGRIGRTEKRKPARKDLSESDASISHDSDSSYELWKPGRKKCHQPKKNIEHELQKAAIKGGEMCEYEKQRMENVKTKLAFLESLKSLEQADLESCNG